MVQDDFREGTDLCTIITQDTMPVYVDPCSGCFCLSLSVGRIIAGTARCMFRLWT